MTSRNFDVIVVGGGVFGLSTALEAGRRGHRAILEGEAGFLCATNCVTALKDLPEKHGVRFATAGSGHGFKFSSLLGRIVLDRIDGIQSGRWTPQFSYDSFLSASSCPRLL